jgi:hypothetical protein
LGIILMRLRSRGRPPSWKYVCKWVLLAIPLSGITGTFRRSW